MSAVESEVAAVPLSAAIAEADLPSVERAMMFLFCSGLFKLAMTSLALDRVRLGHGPTLLEDLGALIDRRARFDPPQQPAPVGQDGYRLVLANNRIPRDPLYVGLTVSAGAYRDGCDNSVELGFNPDGPAWRDIESMRRLFTDLARIWGAKWGAVTHINADYEVVHRFPRLAWTAEPLKARPVPPHLREYPYPLPFDHPPLSIEPHPDLRGDLQLWG